MRLTFVFLFFLLSFQGHTQEKRKINSIYSVCQGEIDKDKCLYNKIQKQILDLYDSKAIELIFKNATIDTIAIRTSLAITINGNVDLINSNISSSDNYIDEINTKILQNFDSFIVQKDNSGNPLSEMIFTPIYFLLDRTNELKSLVSLPYGEEYSTEGLGFAVIDQVPIYKGCENQPKNKMRKCFNERILEHITKNFRYPKKAQRKKISGRVNIMFTINKKGEVTKIRTFGADQILMNEARRIISLIPRMTPGKQRERLVRVPFALPLNFRLK